MTLEVNSSSSLLGILRYSSARSRELLADLPVRQNFERWEETCVPSYCHANPLARLASWLRLFTAVKLARQILPGANKVLDFGASTGELGRLLGSKCDYHFIEQDEAPASYLASTQPRATRTTLQAAQVEAYDCVFALDSLEHNDNYAELLQLLRTKIAPSGILILSGPTENWLYKLGRRIAGFDSHYHMTNISAIEKAAADCLTMVGTYTVPFGLPLFRISAWRHSKARPAS
jgi:2-polyprenyl-3-methyl-5-hydroxy-6-metoxy-1,4-benzoquinol methylase